jgi:hypothetical protein
MFIRPVFAVRDARTGFADPITCPSVEQAVRDWQFFLKTNSDLSLSVADLSLYHVADMDMDSGTVTAVIPPEVVC